MQGQGLKEYHQNPDDPGIVRVPAEDPTGNGEPTEVLAGRDENGNLFRSGIYESVHGGGPFNVRIIQLKADPGAERFFELDADGYAVILKQ